MSVPKTSMHKYCRFVFGKNKIGLAGELFSVQSKAEAGCVQHLPDFNFRFCIFSLNRRHVFASNCRAMYVCHKLSFIGAIQNNNVLDEEMYFLIMSVISR